MRIFRNWRSAALVLLAGFLAAGCVISSADKRESRIKERYAAYSALPPELRTAVDQGLIHNGMNMDAVYIAWGKPSQVFQSGNAAGETTTWVYLGHYDANYWGPYYYAYTPVVYKRAQVVFANGIVKEWQTFGRQ